MLTVKASNVIVLMDSCGLFKQNLKCIIFTKTSRYAYERKSK